MCILNHTPYLMYVRDASPYSSLRLASFCLDDVNMQQLLLLFLRSCSCLYAPNVHVLEFYMFVIHSTKRVFYARLRFPLAGASFVGC